jgi:hypothetical protein
MGKALEVVTGSWSPATTTAGTYGAFTANSGQSFAVRQANGSPAGKVLSPWAQYGAAGFLQVKTPRWHDTTIADTYHVQADTATFAVNPLLDMGDCEPAYSTDILTVQGTTDASQTAATTYSVGLPIYYADLPGVDANFTDWATCQSLVNYNSKVGLHYVSWVKPSSAGTAGQIGPTVLINSVNDQFKAGHSYALLGYLCSAQVGTVLIQGTDTGNLYVGGPGSLDTRTTRGWFVDLSAKYGLPLIPVVQANNKGTTAVAVVDAASTSTAVTIGLIWMDLGVLTPPQGV